LHPGWASPAQESTSAVLKMPDEFGTRLRQQRERRQISLATIAANTKIPLSLLQALERGDVSRWPSGLFRRAFIRSYAQAIGLDPDEIVQEFAEHFPHPADAIDPAAALALKHGLTPKLDSELSPPPSSSSSSPRPRSSAAGVRVTVQDGATPFSSGRILDVRGRWAAIGCDGAVVAALGALCFLIVGEFWAPLAISMFAYYGGGILLLGNTPGVCLFAPVRDRGTSADARSIKMSHAAVRQS
jgi:transcriptional regulator with XRE-family HTH domain